MAAGMGVDVAAEEPGLPTMQLHSVPLPSTAAGWQLVLAAWTMTDPGGSAACAPEAPHLHCCGRAHGQGAGEPALEITPARALVAHLAGRQQNLTGSKSCFFFIHYKNMNCIKESVKTRKRKEKSFCCKWDLFLSLVEYVFVPEHMCVLSVYMCSVTSLFMPPAISAPQPTVSHMRPPCQSLESC